VHYQNEKACGRFRHLRTLSVTQGFSPVFFDANESKPFQRLNGFEKAVKTAEWNEVIRIPG
jgi:hypothetical protein